MAERAVLGWLQPSSWLRRLWAAQAAEEADRAAWLAGVQRRLGLVTTENLLELEVIKDRRLGNA